MQQSGKARQNGGMRHSWQPGHKVEEVKVRMDDNVIWQEHMILAADVLLKKLLHCPERNGERRKKQNVSYYVVRQSQCHKNHYLWTTSSISVPRFSRPRRRFSIVLDGVCFLDAASEERIILLQNHDNSTTAPLGVWSINRMRTHLTKKMGDKRKLARIKRREQWERLVERRRIKLTQVHHLIRPKNALKLYSKG